jgi:hypothetical protein
VDINAPSRKYQDAQHSSVGRVNLGARIAPKASRKCQEDFLLSHPGFIQEKRIYPDQEEKH